MHFARRMMSVKAKFDSKQFTNPWLNEHTHVTMTAKKILWLQRQPWRYFCLRGNSGDILVPMVSTYFDCYGSIAAIKILRFPWQPWGCFGYYDNEGDVAPGGDKQIHTKVADLFQCSFPFFGAFWDHFSSHIKKWHSSKLKIHEVEFC